MMDGNLIGTGCARIKMGITGVRIMKEGECHGVCTKVWCMTPDWDGWLAAQRLASRPG